MANNRSQLNLMDKVLFIDMIYDLIPDKRLMLLRYHEYYKELADPSPKFPGMTLIPVTIKDPKMFERIKFEYIKHIKTLPDPRDRVADWEFRDENGLPDFDRYDRLVEKRKTREEKAKELQDEIELKKQFDKYKIPYIGPLNYL